VSEQLTLVTSGADQTRALARSMAHLCVPGDIMLLAGDLGAGKTTFAQGFGAGLGIDEAITSPTFTLVRQYPVHLATGPAGPAGPAAAGPAAGAGIRCLLHADVYRLDHLAEIADLGLGELVEDGGVALVEWGDAARPVLGRGSLGVHLTACDDDDDRRLITVERPDDVWAARWPALRAAVEPWLTAA
jgi:tRNA threonylcarbamoyladenosine biosynthesis protein TsaE